MLLLSGTIETIAEFYYVLFNQKQKSPRNFKNKKKHALGIMKSTVN